MKTRMRPSSCNQEYFVVFLDNLLYVIFSYIVVFILRLAFRDLSDQDSQSLRGIPFCNQIFTFNSRQKLSEKIQE